MLYSDFCLCQRESISSSSCCHLYGSSRVTWRMVKHCSLTPSVPMHGKMTGESVGSGLFQHPGNELKLWAVPKVVWCTILHQLLVADVIILIFFRRGYLKPERCYTMPKVMRDLSFIKSINLRKFPNLWESVFLAEKGIYGFITVVCR